MNPEYEFQKETTERQKQMKPLFTFVFALGISALSGLDYPQIRNARNLEKEKRWDEAIALYEKLASETVEEKDVQQYIQWAIAAALSKKDRDLALRLAQSVKNPDRKLFVMSTVLTPAEIVKQMSERDLARFPDDIRSDMFSIRGTAYYSLKQYDNALRDYETALKTPGGQAMRLGWAAYYSGIIHEQKKERGKAIDAYRNALALSKGDYAWRCLALLRLSEMLIEDGKSAEACRLFEPVSRLSGKKGYWAVRLNHGYAAALAASGRKVEAVRILDAAMKNAPDEADRKKIKKQLDRLTENLL